MTNKLSMSTGTHFLRPVSPLRGEIPGKTKGLHSCRLDRMKNGWTSHRINLPTFLKKKQHTDTQTHWCRHRQISGLLLISPLCLCDRVFLSMTNPVSVCLCMCVCVCECGRGRRYVGQGYNVPDMTHNATQLTVQLVQNFTIGSLWQYHTEPALLSAA